MADLKRYYFYRRGTGYDLAPVIAESEDEAWDLLPVTHAWCGANKDNCVLSMVVDIIPGMWMNI